jgi:zinc/manganese transport system substrate-binding protein
VVALVAVAAALAACSSLAPPVASSDGDATRASVGGDCPGATPIDVVAAEDFWGSIAAQLGGRYVRVTSIIDNPGADPHDYEPTAGDGRTVATARYVIANGLGYDPWITKLADANPDPDRAVLDIGQHLGLQAGDNPHRWYFPGDVDRVIDRISAGGSYRPRHRASTDSRTSIGLKASAGTIASSTRSASRTPVRRSAPRRASPSGWRRRRG